MAQNPDLSEYRLVQLDLSPKAAVKFDAALSGNDNDILLAIEKAVQKTLGYDEYDGDDFPSDHIQVAEPRGADVRDWLKVAR